MRQEGGGSLKLITIQKHLIGSLPLVHYYLSRYCANDNSMNKYTHITRFCRKGDYKSHPLTVLGMFRTSTSTKETD